MSDTHFLANLLGFVRALRSAGIPVAPEQAMACARALPLIDIGDVSQVFGSTRAMLLSDHAHFALFESIFNRFFVAQSREVTGGAQKAPVAPRHARPETLFDITTYMAFKARLFDEEIDVTDRRQTFSNAEVLQRKDFAHMSDEEIDTLKTLMRELDWPVLQRLTRRRKPARRGEDVHLRRTLRNAARTGGIALTLPRQTRKARQRPLVLLADISGSMEKYSRVMLMFFHSLGRVLRDTHSFVFATRLSNITPALKLRNVDRALQDAGHAVRDWAGGTRIGESLRAFNQNWARRVLRRGAIVLLVTDGWERGDCALLKQQMRHLKGRAHRLIWLNPLSGGSQYEATVEGARAMLPHTHAFLPVHNLESLRALSAHLAQQT
jgi:uncharacterized protein